MGLKDKISSPKFRWIMLSMQSKFKNLDYHDIYDAAIDAYYYIVDKHDDAKSDFYSSWYRFTYYKCVNTSIIVKKRQGHEFVSESYNDLLSKTKLEKGDNVLDIVDSLNQEEKNIVTDRVLGNMTFRELGIKYKLPHTEMSKYVKTIFKKIRKDIEK